MVGVVVMRLLKQNACNFMKLYRNGKPYHQLGSYCNSKQIEKSNRSKIINFAGCKCIELLYLHVVK